MGFREAGGVPAWGVGSSGGIGKQVGSAGQGWWGLEVGGTVHGFRGLADSSGA